MTPKELFERLQDYLQSLVWVVAGNKIFGDNVFITPAMPAHQLSQFPAPACFIIPEGQRSHDEHNNIIEQKFSIMLFVENLGQAMGQSGIMGGNRIANSSNGAGMLDIEDKILQGIREQTVLTAAKIVFLSKSRTRNSVVKSNNPIITRNLNFEARVSYL